MDDQKSVTKVMEDKEEKDSTQLQKTVKIVDATVNPSSAQTRVDCNSSLID